MSEQLKTAILEEHKENEQDKEKLNAVNEQGSAQCLSHQDDTESVCNSGVNDDELEETNREEQQQEDAEKARQQVQEKLAHLRLRAEELVQCNNKEYEKAAEIYSRPVKVVTSGSHVYKIQLVCVCTK